MSVEAILNKDILDYISQYTELKKTGNTYRGACPIHQGNNDQSLAVFLDTNKYHCFTCGSGGNIINFVADYSKLTYHEATEKLAEEFNLDLGKDKKYLKTKSHIQKCDGVVRIAQGQINKVEEYLTKKRGLTKITIEDFKLGADDKCIFIPLPDIHGRPIALAYRYHEGKPKYRNSKNNEWYDKSSYLYNMDKARKLIKDKFYLAEGYFDVMSVHQEGEPALGYCGIEITKEQVIALGDLTKLTPNLTAIWVLDNDDKAVKHLTKVRDRFIQYAPKLTVRVGVLPEGIKDLNDYLVAGYKLEDLPTEPLDIFALNHLLNKCSNREAEYKVVEEFISTVKNAMIKSDIAKLLAERWNKTEKEVRDWLSVNHKSLDDVILEFKDPLACLREFAELVKSEGIQFGFPALDRALKGGGRKGEVTFIGAYSSVGKTMLAIQIVMDMIIRQGLRIVFFSLEMSAGALYERIVANILGKSTREVEQMMKAGDPLIYQIVEKIQKRLYIIDKNNLSVEDIEERVAIANSRIFDQPVDVIVIDYLQYMKGTNNYEEISATARQFKPLAKNNNIMVVCLSQLNRGAMAWERPTMNQLKGAGDIEATGDIILMMWKPSLNPNMPPIDKELLKNQLMLGIAKARRGFLADEFELAFNPQETRIREVIDMENVA